MEKYNEVIGLPVLCIDNGKKIGNVEDVIFCPKTKEVKAFVLERTGCSFHGKVILKEDILNLGRDAVVVSDCACPKSRKEIKNMDGFSERAAVKGLRVYTKYGEDLGIVEDILFDFKYGIIEGVEISGGLFQDIIQGRKVLPLFGNVEFGKENILVDREAVEEMMSTGGGLKKLFVYGKHKIKD